MSTNYAVIRNRHAQLSELHVRECELNLRLNQEGQCTRVILESA